MSALDRLGDLGGWRGFWLFCLLVASAKSDSEKQLDEIKELGT